MLNALRKGDRQSLSRAITLIESHAKKDRIAAMQLMEQCLASLSSSSFRIGITGVPGVGKSTLINTLGGMFTATGQKLAVLAVDPSSVRGKGSILGDKTRMEDLSNDPMAYIRPTPTGGALGGVARRTKETIELCETAGYSRILVETVGVGQSELEVGQMTDMTVLLVLAGAGDELQGIKRGIMESADLIMITKVDGDNTVPSERARVELRNAVLMLPARPHGARANVLLCSASEGTGLTDLYNAIEAFGDSSIRSGYRQKQREAQQVHWMFRIAQDMMLEEFNSNKIVVDILNGALKNSTEPRNPYEVAKRAIIAFRKGGEPPA